ncbi:Uncharacterized protein SCF082_LOCUS31486 [Durusdinium trenchii]|uniref:Uncharacterized protein n=1 Tax=Durusdinium trenchii TaxID=1381693 RepID=A0ABP0N7J7_9DINO
MLAFWQLNKYLKEQNLVPVTQTRQHHGIWERKFLFDHSDGRFELCEEEAELEGGVLTIVLRNIVGTDNIDAVNAPERPATRPLRRAARVFVQEQKSSEILEAGLLTDPTVKVEHAELCCFALVCRRFEFAGVKMEWWLDGSRLWVMAPKPAVFEVNCHMTGQQFELPSSREHGYQGHSASDCADDAVHMFDITVLEIDGLCLRSLIADRNSLVRAQKQAEELHQKDTLELKHLHAILGEEENQAGKRIRIMAAAASKLQSKWRDAFNSKNRDYLLQSLEHGNTLGSNIVLTDLLCAELSRLLPKFVSIENTEPEASESIQCPAMLSVKFESRAEHADPHAESAVYTPLGSMCIHLSPEKAHLSTKTRGVISPLGEIIAHDVSFDPIVNVFDKSISTGIQRFIRIECPGVVDDDIEWEELPNGVKITINKKPPIEEHSVQPVEPIRQHHGVWEREFLFDHSDGRFELCEEEAELEAGVLTMVLRKTLQPRKGKLQGKARARASYQASGWFLQYIVES